MQSITKLTTTLGEPVENFMGSAVRQNLVWASPTLRSKTTVNVLTAPDQSGQHLGPSSISARVGNLAIRSVE